MQIFPSRLHPLLHHITTIILLILILITLYARLTHLSTNPPGFYMDEASIAYNGFTLANSGLDEYGLKFPIYFKAFGEYKNPIYIYSQIPFLKFFGLNSQASRLDATAWGLLTLIAFMFLSHYLTKSITLSLLTTAIFITNPWHFLLSRVSFEIITFPFFLILSALFLYLFQRTDKLRPLYFFSFTLGVSFFSYTAARFISPFLFLSALVIYRRKLSPKKAFTSLLIFLFTLLPAFIYYHNYPQALLTRYHTLSLFDHSSLIDAIKTTSTNFLLHFHPNFLFYHADEYLRHTPAWHSVFFLSTIPIFVLGFIHILSHPKDTFNRWVLLGLVVAPLPAAITVQSPHALRSISLLPFAMILTILGAKQLLQYKQQPLVALVFTSLLFLESICFFNYFTTQYPNKAAVWFDTNYIQSFQQLSHLPPPFFFPRDYYPGLYLTWLFVTQTPLAHHDNPQANQVFFQDVPRLPYLPGTYIIDSNFCSQISSDFTDNAIFQPSSLNDCIFIYNP